MMLKKIKNLVLVMICSLRIWESPQVVTSKVSLLKEGDQASIKLITWRAISSIEANQACSSNNKSKNKKRPIPITQVGSDWVQKEAYPEGFEFGSDRVKTILLIKGSGTRCISTTRQIGPKRVNWTGADRLKQAKLIFRQGQNGSTHKGFR
jgi:hypothetical protein